MARPVKFDTDQLLDKAMRLFWRQGYEATSVQNLVDELAIHPGSLYNTFGDKHALFLAALDRYAKTDGQYLICLLQQPGSAKGAIENVLLYSARMLPTPSGRPGCLMTNSAVELAETDPDVARKVADYQTQFEATLVEVLQRAQQSGELRARSSDETRALARFLNGCLQGMRVLAKASPDPGRLDDIAQLALKVLD